MLVDIMASFASRGEVKEEEEAEESNQNEDASALPWLQKFITQSPVGKESETNETRSEAESIPSRQTAEPVKKMPYPS